MSCSRMGDLVHAYVDQELSLTEQVSFEQHLATCPECEQARRDILKLRGELAAGGLRFELPSDVRSRVLQTARGSGAGGWLRPIALAAAACLAVIALTLATISISTGGAWRSTAPSLMAAIVDAHVRSLQPGHLVDVASTDQHTVKPWFDGKVDFAPPVRDLAAQGFPLIGGRLDYLEGHQAAALVYGRRKHLINVFIWPEPGVDQSPAASQLQGYQMIRWRTAGMRLVAVSDLNAAELGDFARILQ